MMSLNNFAMRPGDSDARAAKRRKRISQSLDLEPHSEPHLNPSMLNLDHLPDLVLIEIICRLPLASAAQCMCVSKRWFSLVSSNPYFVRRFLCVQSENQKPIPRALIFMNPRQPREFFVTSSSNPLLSLTRNMNFNFLPCFQGPINTPEYEPIVVGAYNDLVLCCATLCFQRDYYICNPYIRQWDALPPALRCHQEVRVGFICEPYYYYNYKKQQCEEEDHRKEEVEEESDARSRIRLNVEYRYKVVRIIPQCPEKSFEFNMEMFFSETGVAHNGMLYCWSSSDGFVIGLDPYSNDGSNTAKYCFHFIDKPQDESESDYGRTFDFMGMSSRGRLRMCQYSPYTDGDVSVWELKDDHQMDKDMDTDDAASACNDNDRWCLAGRVTLLHMLPENQLMITRKYHRKWLNTVMVLAFHPNDDDILFLEFSQHIIMCNIHVCLFRSLHKAPIPVTWEKPKIGWTKLNFDVSSKGKAGKASIGGLFRNHKADFSLGYAEPIGRANSMIAELAAVRRGLELVLENRWSNVWLGSKGM
ncbi:uncharacterized protein Pyn_15392 [Prunus yedoensis var. nudiflora]|uniref:F-box domain-containing protein n=1 Tax=Prunus yedoensis var. nudiflora TaxID=2094558 RepID=A0A314YLY0_PRUYE|nr:uncharacterized protein Pyn_15392 [Prunus yedoensis var. nudiflora]